MNNLKQFLTKKSKLGFVFVAIYVFLIVACLLYYFACNREAEKIGENFCFLILFLPFGFPPYLVVFSPLLNVLFAPLEYLSRLNNDNAIFAGMIFTLVVLYLLQGYLVYLTGSLIALIWRKIRSKFSH